MASLEKRNGKYRVIFRFGGEKFSRSLNTTDRRNAHHMLAQLEDNLRRLELGTLSLEPGVDIPTLLLSSGAISQRPKVTKAPLLGQLLDRYLNSIPNGSMEQSTLGMLNTHVRHLNQLMGVRTRLESLSLERLQSYVNDRSLETGFRGRLISPVTIKKELSTPSYPKTHPALTSADFQTGRGDVAENLIRGYWRRSADQRFFGGDIALRVASRHDQRAQFPCAKLKLHD